MSADLGWIAAPVVCWYCGTLAVSVYPASIDGQALECPRCHLMTCFRRDLEEVPPGQVPRDRDEEAL